MGETKLTELAKGFRKRTLVTARLGAKLSMKAARRSLGSAKPDADATSEAIAKARKLVLEMGQLKGLVMKVGQMASYLPGAVPEEMQSVFAELQAQSIAMESDKVVAVLEEELGAPVDTLFDEFEREPFAAASIGQVHRAVFEGRPVAVKVQYPGIEELLRSDMKTVGMLARMATMGMPSDGKALAHELGARILEECDYRREAAHQTMFAGLLGEIEGVSVPAVVPERSARRVLTTELVDALPFAAFLARADQDAKNRAGARIWAATFELLFHRGTYNADPHPGNYLFSEDGHVWLLDYGCVRHFEREFVERWKRYAKALVALDEDAHRDAFVGLGMVPKPKKLDWDYQWRAAQHLYRPMLRERFGFTDEYVKESYGLHVFDSPNKFHLAMPAEWLLLNRLQWGLYAVLSSLQAEADFATPFRTAIESPTEVAGDPA